MPQNDSWQYQGRQAHGRFGSGTKPWTADDAHTAPSRSSPLTHQVAAFARREVAQSMGMPSATGPSEADIDAAARYLTAQFGRLLETIGIDPGSGPMSPIQPSWRSGGRWRYPSWLAPAQDMSVVPADTGGDEPQQGEEKAATAGEATLSDDRRRYILDGDGKGRGGHRAGRGTPGKSEFPSEWSDDMIASTIEQIANDRSSTRVTNKGRTEVRGTRNGIDILVIIGRDRSTIVTAYPTNVPRNKAK